jgi:S1-C subfamily serine protease
MDNCITISEASASGTGFIIDHNKDNTIVMTAAHLCESTKNVRQSSIINFEITEIRNTHEMGIIKNQQLILSQQILYNDPVTDVCVFKIPRVDGEKVRIAKGAPRYGDKIWSIGAPVGFFPESSKPLVSGHYAGGAERSMKNDPSLGFYNFSMPTVPGMSGSPIFNNNGEVIGIVSAVHSDWHMICFSPTHDQIIKAIEAAKIALKNQE